MKRIVVLTAVLFFGPRNLSTEEADLASVMVRVFERLAKDVSVKRALLSCTNRERVEDLKKPEQERLKSEKNYHYRIYGNGNLLMRKPLKENGEIDEGAPEKPLPYDIDETLLSRYRFEWDYPEVTKNGKTYLIQFFPKEDGLLFKEERDEALNRLRGTISVDKQSYLIRRLEGHISSGGFRKFPVAVDEFEVEINQEELDGTGIVTRVSSTIRRHTFLGFFGSKVHERRTNTFEECTFASR